VILKKIKNGGDIYNIYIGMALKSIFLVFWLSFAVAFGGFSNQEAQF
jgi:hypothetical protein